jgi:hypothetical protein
MLNENLNFQNDQVSLSSSIKQKISYNGLLSEKSENENSNNSNQDQSKSQEKNLGKKMSITIKKKEHKMTEQEKELNRKILKNMNKKLNFLKNPRFRIQQKCLLYSNEIFNEILSKENPFVVEPVIIIFREYQLNSVYQIDLKLTNRKQILTSFKYIPPSTQNFSLRKIIYPKKDSSLIAPGMNAKIEILFNATSLDSFEDEISIITEFFAFKVPLKAIREKPSLSLENPMNCGKCLIGDQTSMIFRCKNYGGDAHFKFSTENINNNNSPHNNAYNNAILNQNLINDNDQSDYRVDNEVLTAGPFSIFPQEFYLYKGMSVEILVNFCPKKEGLIEKDLIIICDSKVNLPQKIIGEGIKVDFKIISLDDLVFNENSDTLENLFFEDAYPSTSISRKIKIKNLSEYELKYHWNIYDKYEMRKHFMDNQDTFFSIEPEKGFFEPLEEIGFNINFQPKNCKNYEQKIDLVIEDIPFTAIKNFKINSQNTNENFSGKNNNVKLARNTFTKGEPFLLALNSPYPSYPFFSFNLVGKGKQSDMDIEYTLIDLGKVFIGEKVSRSFSIKNTKSGQIIFKIKKILQGMNNSNLNLDCNKRDIFSYISNTNETNIANFINNFFKEANPKETFRDHFRTESIFKMKKIIEKNFNNNIDNNNKQNFLSRKNKNMFDNTRYNNNNNINNINISNPKLNNINNKSNNDNDNIIDGNKTIYFNLGKLSEMNKTNKSPISNNNNISINNFENSLNDNNNFISNINIPFLKIFTAKKNFFNKIFEDNNNNSPKNITKHSSSNNSNSKILKNNIKIIPLQGQNQGKNQDQGQGQGLENKIKNNSISMIIKKPDSVLTSLNSKSNKNYDNLLMKKKGIILEPIKETNNNFETTKNEDDKIFNNNYKNNNLTKSYAPTKSKYSFSSNYEKEKNQKNNNNLNNQIEIYSKKKNFNRGMSKNLSNNINNEKNITPNNNNNLQSTNISKSIFSGFSGNNNNNNIPEDEDLEIIENDELILNKDESVSLNIQFQAYKLGRFKCSCILKAEDGIPLSVDFSAYVVGPQIKADISCIHFGLFPVSEIKVIKFKLINLSKVPARFLIKERKFKNINFDNYINSEYLRENEGIIKDKKTRRGIKEIGDFINENLRVMDINIIDNYEIKFYPLCGFIDENSEIEITVK